MSELTAWQKLRILELVDLIRSDLQFIGYAAVGSGVVPWLVSTQCFGVTMRREVMMLRQAILREIDEASRLN